VAFITTDQNHVGGQAKLVSLGSALGIPVQVVASHDEIETALESFAVRKLVIIDTKGVSHRERTTIEKFVTLSAEHRDIQPYLVRAASTQEAVINDTIEAYARVPLAGAIVTKVDEGSSMGAVVSGLVRCKLPISFIGNGQRITEDLHGPSIDYFLNKIMEAHVMPKAGSTRQQHYQKVEKIDQVANA